MNRFATRMSHRAKLAVGALALGALALPAAFASAQDPSAELSPEQVEEGRQLFNDWACGACHVMGDAGTVGQVGPAMDGNAALDYEFTVSRITHGQGAMPGFGGQMTDEEIALLSTYIVQNKK